MDKNTIINGIKRATELATNITVNGVRGIEGDHLQYPEVYIDNAGKGDLFNVPLGDKYIILKSDNIYISIPAPIINVTRKKTIKNSVVKGLDSSIFQIVSNGDYNINVKFSFITDKAWKRKREDFQTALDIFNTQKSIKVINSFLNEDFNINNVVIDNYSIQPDSNYSNVINVTINMKYDANYNIFQKYEDNITKISY